jgi:3-oxoadipate enol-lactonase
MNEHALNHDEASIRYWVSGDDQAPTVVLTHGATLDHGAFAGQVQALTAAGYRCVTWDMCGHGASQPLPGDRFSLEQPTKDLHALLDHADVDRAVLIGQSFGGFVAQRLLARAAERVVALVLIGTPPLTDDPIDAALSLHHRVLNRMRPTLLRLWPERHLRRVLPTFMSADPAVRRYVAQATALMPKSAMVAVTRAALEALACRGQPHAIPTLVSYGEREPHRWTVELILDRASRNPHMNARAVPDAGHLANQDNPEAFNTALIEFLQRHAPVTGAAKQT